MSFDVLTTAGTGWPGGQRIIGVMMHDSAAASNGWGASAWSLLIALALACVCAGETLAKGGGLPQEGVASIYADELNGKKTASGEKYDRRALTAAHLTLPFGTRVKVTNKDNGKTAVVRINDRGPHVKGRILDLSSSAAAALGFSNGVAPVRIEAVR